ncbi:hypothetical protein NIES25_48380 [Nostoc linckia NIES-25]|nr:hypothetical protein NIES25_48380 [Nostoc linckia NIES-25]
MQTLTLAQLFGVNAVQTADKLIIKKSDLSAFGLTPSENNRAEQLLVAVLLQALSNFQGYLVNESGNLLSDENGNIIGYDNRKLYELLEMFRWDAYVKKREQKVYLTETIVIHSYDETIQ